MNKPKIQSTHEPDERLTYNQWATHIHNQLNQVRQKLGGISYQRKEAEGSVD
jgi:hypothetical protein